MFLVGTTDSSYCQPMLRRRCRHDPVIGFKPIVALLFAYVIVAPFDHPITCKCPRNLHSSQRLLGQYLRYWYKRRLSLLFRHKECQDSNREHCQYQHRMTSQSKWHHLCKKSLFHVCLQQHPHFRGTPRYRKHLHLTEESLFHKASYARRCLLPDGRFHQYLLLHLLRKHYHFHRCLLSNSMQCLGMAQ